MGAQIIERSYQDPITGDWLPFLRENALGKVNAFIRYENEYYVGSGTTNTFTVSGLAITIQNGEWQDEDKIAIVAGQTVTIEFDDGATTNTFTKTITDVNGNTFFIDSVMTGYTNNVFPSGALSGMKIYMDQAPASVEFDFNLTQEASPVAESVIDGNVNRFKVDNVDTLALSTPVAMTQMGQFKSGGHIENVTLEIEDDDSGPRNISRTIKINYTFYQWGIIQDGFPEPDYYPLAPYQNARNYTVNNNLDGIQEAKSPATTGNLAAYNQNFSFGGNPYSTTSCSWFDSQGNQIDGPDYSNECTFKAVVNAPNQSTTLSRYKIGLVWRPLDSSRYQDKADKIGEVLKWSLANDTIFQHSTTPDTTVYTGLTDDNARFDLTDLQFLVNGTTLNVNGKVIPVNMESFFAGVNPIPDGDRELTLSISIADHSLDADSTDRVELQLFKGDCIDAPTIGIQHPYVFNENLLDHAGINITANTTPNTTTNDDLLYKSRFQLEKNTVYDGVRAEIYVLNDITNERFTLESNYFDFSDTASGAYVNGIHEYNKTINRNFLLPITSDRNVIKLERSQNLDTPTLYGMQIDYGFVSRIESWIANPDVANHFFDNNLLNNGKNENWERFTDGDWQLYIAYYVVQNDVSDFQVYNVKTRPFDDDPNFTYGTPTLTMANGTVVNGIGHDPQNPSLNVQIPVTYTNPFLDEWFTVQLRNFQGAAIGFISTEHDRDNVQVPNALEPTTGETRLKKTISGTTAILEFEINTSLISVNNVSLAVRSYSFDRREGKDYKLTTDGKFKRTTDGYYKTLA